VVPASGGLTTSDEQAAPRRGQGASGALPNEEKVVEHFNWALQNTLSL
jgi:hypothetical protein